MKTFVNLEILYRIRCINFILPELTNWKFVLRNTRCLETSGKSGKLLNRITQRSQKIYIFSICALWIHIIFFSQLNWSFRLLGNVFVNWLSCYYKLYVFFFRPELKPIEKEVEVVLRFPETLGLSPPILQLNEVGFSYNPDMKIFNNVNIGATLESRICIVSTFLIHNIFLYT